MLSLALASAALAEEHEGPTPSRPLGIDLSLRVGPAAGNLAGLNGPMFPLWLGLGYRFGGVWYVGVAGVFAPGPTVSSGGVTESLYNCQLLVEMAVHPASYARVDPWVGFGIGGEWFNGGKGTFVPVSFDLGVDFGVLSSFRVGPFAAVQAAFNGNDVHEWFTVGLKFTVLP